MMKRFRVLIMLLTAALLAGCQATPDQPVVVQKDLEQMIEKGMSNRQTPAPLPATTPAEDPKIDYAALCAHYGVPERYQTTIAEGNLTISCDVAIELPNTMKLPMERVEAGRFSQEAVYALFGALCGDTPMVLVPSVWDKAYYEQAIIKAQAELAKETEKNSIRQYNDMINELKEQYKKAPDTMEITPCDGTLQIHKFGGVEYGGMAGTSTILYATSDPRNLENPMTVYVQNDADYDKTTVASYTDEFGNEQIIAPSSGSNLQFSREGQNTWFGLYDSGTKLADVTALSLSGGVAENCLLGTTPRQAREVVERFLSESKTYDMMIDTVCLYSSKRDPPPELIEDIKLEGRMELEEKPETHAYVFRLLRQVNGVKTESCHESSETSTDGMSFGKQWYYEELTVVVDDKGIASVYWMGPLAVKELITDHAAVLPFGDIAHIFDKMMVVTSDIYTIPERRQQIDITRASLSLQRIMEQDSYTTGLLVPVWNFYGKVTDWGSDGEKHTSEWAHMPLLSINAIDGSVIDVFKGY
jgi:hypothetical protein